MCVYTFIFFSLFCFAPILFALHVLFGLLSLLLYLHNFKKLSCGGLDGTVYTVCEDKAHSIWSLIRQTLINVRAHTACF